MGLGSGPYLLLPSHVTLRSLLNLSVSMNVPVLDISQDKHSTTKNVWKWNGLLQEEVMSTATRVVKIENGKKNTFHCRGDLLWIGVSNWEMSPRFECVSLGTPQSPVMC